MAVRVLSAKEIQKKLEEAGFVCRIEGVFSKKIICTRGNEKLIIPAECLANPDMPCPIEGNYTQIIMFDIGGKTNVAVIPKPSNLKYRQPTIMSFEEFKELVKKITGGKS